MLLPVVKMCSQSSFKDSSDRGYPDDWEVVRADCLFTLEYGKGLSEKERVAGPYPVMGSNGVVGYHNEAAVKGPGIVVGRKGSIGAVTWVDSDFWPIDTTYYVKIRRHDVSLKWLFYELAYLNPAKFRLADVVPGLKRELVHSVKVHLPLLPEQEKIAEILSVVDSAVELVDKVIAKTERLKKGLMQTLLTKGIGHIEFKETRIGRIPKEWDIAKLGEIATIRYGLGQPPESDENGTPMIRATNIKRGVIVETDVLRVKRSTIPESRNPFLREGDVIVVRSGAYTGDIGHITKRWEGAIAGYDLVVSPSNRINSVYLAHYLLSLRVQTYFSQLKSRSAQPHLNSEQVSDTPIALPSLSEQRNIADFLSTIDKKLGLERNEKVRLERVKRGLMDLLLTGKVRVKVN